MLKRTEPSCSSRGQRARSLPGAPSLGAPPAEPQPLLGLGLPSGADGTSDGREHGQAEVLVLDSDEEAEGLPALSRD